MLFDKVSRVTAVPVSDLCRRGHQTSSKMLLSTYDLGDGKLANVLTPYAIAAIAMEAGAEQLKAFHGDHDVNRWIDDRARRNGSLLEAQFYAELYKGSVTVYVGVERIETVWHGRTAWLAIDQDYRNEALHPLLAQRHSPQWWKRPRLKPSTQPSLPLSHPILPLLTTSDCKSSFMSRLATLASHVQAAKKGSILRSDI